MRRDLPGFAVAFTAPSFLVQFKLTLRIILLAWAISPNAHRPSVITKDEIEARAGEFGLHAANIERDYVFGWLLAGIYGAGWLKDALILKGGNCFAAGR
jgi:hypothetical protein